MTNVIVANIRGFKYYLNYKKVRDEIDPSSYAYSGLIQNATRLDNSIVEEIKKRTNCFWPITVKKVK